MIEYSFNEFIYNELIHLKLKLNKLFHSFFFYLINK